MSEIILTDKTLTSLKNENEKLKEENENLNENENKNKNENRKLNVNKDENEDDIIKILIHSNDYNEKTMDQNKKKIK